MTPRHATPAEKVVNSFKHILSQSGREHVGEKHFSELSLMVESAISAAVLEEMEGAADRMDELAKKIRNSAERWED